MPARSLLLVLLLLALAACGRTPPTRGTRAEPARPPARETAQCHADLRAEGVDFRVLPDRDFGNGCGVFGAVQLTDIGVPVTGITAMRCGTARAFAGWVRNAAVPGAYQMLGSELARIEGMGSYACRNVVGSTRNAGRRSGHALANAVDVGGFVLKDGRRVSVLGDWNGPDERAREFLRTMRRSACRRFGTVLSPDYNAAHANHLHLEDDGARFCR
ncbi:extensin family protein [Sphingomonas rubra]|uniref:Extensin-like protein C-terminus n=1 Tax=Sphingomonas rubra TaxID=634430 RepID=A0A1I5UDH7_9SPHN|nr:extensin family protein [Sphingomonas rubra]SFP93323.1 Extensin-like protein C-terminus [Sphingomonas rubra]